MLPLDASSPKTLAHVPALVQDKCQSFGWYLDEVRKWNNFTYIHGLPAFKIQFVCVFADICLFPHSIFYLITLLQVYPGLKKDIAGVQSEYVAFINSGYQETLLQPILDQYKQEQSHVTYIDSEVSITWHMMCHISFQ